MMRLEDACELIVDCPHSTARDEGKGFPLIRTPNIGRGRFLLENVHRVSESVYNKRNARAVPKDDDIILAREAPAGNVAIIKNGVKMCLGQRTVLLRPNKEVVNPDFLTYFLLAPEQQYGLLGTANGATVAHVNIPTIRNLKIKLPPLKTQERIGKILSAYDDLIENNQRQIKLLEEAAQRLYKEWFVNFRFPGYEDTPIVDGVPEGWADGTLGDIAVFKRGKTITKAQVSDGNIPVVAGGLEPAYYHNKANTTAPLITVSASGANAGFTRLYNIDVFASDCSYIDSNSTPFLLFVYCFLKTNAMKLNSLQKGSAQPHVYAKDLNALVLSVPSEGVLTAFCGIVSPYFERIRLLQRENEIAAQARDRLLPKLMSGEIEA